MGYKVIKAIDKGINVVIAIILLLFLLVGSYFTYDTAYVFYNASGLRNGLRHKYAANEVVEVKEFTEDYRAWVEVDDTSISYPIMQGKTNNDYLSMDPYGNYALSGSIFLDFRNAPDFSDSYSLVYGHHMSGGFMFGSLDNYYEKKYFDSHPTGTLKVGDDTYKLTAFAVLSTDANVYEIFEPNGSERVLKVARESSMIYIEPPEGARILALSTCKDPANTSRTVVLFWISDDPIAHTESN